MSKKWFTFLLVALMAMLLVACGGGTTETTAEPTADGWTLRPQLPRHWRRLAFTYRANGQPVEVDIQRDEGGEYRVRHTNR